MPVPPAVLQQTLSTKSDLSNAPLAAKMLVAKLRVKVTRDPNEMPNALSELSKFSESNGLTAQNFA